MPFAVHVLNREKIQTYMYFLYVCMIKTRTYETKISNKVNAAGVIKLKITCVK